MEKLNLIRIIRDHIQTLKNYNSGRYSFWDFVVFLLFPLVIAGCLTYFLCALNKDLINTLITSLSVFAALLFNLLLLIYDIVKKANPSDSFAELKTRFLREIYANISYSILISMLAIILLLVSSLNVSNHFFQTALTYLVYFLLGNFILTLFMILRRVHILLSTEFEKVK